MYKLPLLRKFSTRIISTSSWDIDNCITNLSKNNLCLTGIKTEISDHDDQVIDILNVYVNSWKTIITTKYCRKINNESIKTLEIYLASETWLEVYEAPVHLKYNVFHDTFMLYFNVCCPKSINKLAAPQNKSLDYRWN